MTTEIMMTNKQFMALREKHQGLPVNISVLIRDVEQAVLQSPEIQALRKDAGRWRAWRKANVEGDNGFMDRYLEYGNDDEDFTEAFMDASLDAAMGQQK